MGDTKNKNLLTEISFAHLNLASDDKIKQVFAVSDPIAFYTDQGRCFICSRDIPLSNVRNDYPFKVISTEIIFKDFIFNDMQTVQRNRQKNQ